MVRFTLDSCNGVQYRVGMASISRDDAAGVTPHLKVYGREFEIVSDEDGSEMIYDEEYDAEHPAPFETVDCVPDDEDETAVDIAVEWLERNGPGPWQPDVVPGAASWFNSLDESELAGTEVTVSLHGFTVEQRAAITRRVYR